MFLLRALWYTPHSGDLIDTMRFQCVPSIKAFVGPRNGPNGRIPRNPHAARAGHQRLQERLVGKSKRERPWFDRQWWFRRFLQQQRGNQSRDIFERCFCKMMIIFEQVLLGHVLLFGNGVVVNSRHIEPTCSVILQHGLRVTEHRRVVGAVWPALTSTWLPQKQANDLHVWLQQMNCPLQKQVDRLSVKICRGLVYDFVGVPVIDGEPGMGMWQ